MNRFCCSNWTTWILAIFSPSLMVLAILLLPPLQVAIAIKTRMMPIANSQIGLDNVLAQVRALRRGSREATPLRTTSSPSSTECRPSNLPISATRASSQWPPPLCVLLCRGSLPLVLYYASHLGSNLGPRIWGPWTWGPIAPCNAGPLRPLVL